MTIRTHTSSTIISSANKSSKKSTLSLTSIALAIGLTVLSTASYAATTVMPDSGWYWNPNESGRGYNIEVQDDTLVISAYGYENGGKQLWYFGSSKLVGDTASGSLDRFKNGACFTCEQKAPDLDAGQSVPFKLVFGDALNANLTIDGKTIKIERFGFGVDLNSETSVLGEWAIVESASSGNHYGDRLAFDKMTINNGVPMALGQRMYRSGGASFGRSSSDPKTWLMVSVSGYGYYTAYLLKRTGMGSFVGISTVFKTTPDFSNNAMLASMHMTTSATDVKTGTGPGILSVKSSAADDEAIIKKRMSATSLVKPEDAGITITPEIIAELQKMAK